MKLAGLRLLVALGAALGAWASENPLIDAAENGSPSAVQAALANNADVNAAEPDGTTALHWAARNDDAATAELLIRAGANVKVANRYGVTALALACTNGSAGMIEKLLRAGADVNAASPEGETALMTASRTGKLDAVQVLLAHGASVNAVEKWRGQSALMWAAAEGHPAVVEALLKAGADMHARSKGPPARGGSENRPNEAKLGEAKAGGAGANGNRSNEANSTEVGPSGTGPKENRPNEANSNVAQLGGTGSNETRPNEANPEVAKLGGAGVNQNRRNEANSTVAEPNNIRPSEINLTGTGPNGIRSNEAKSTVTEPSGVGANQNRPNEAKLEDAKLAGTGANQNRPNEANSTGTGANGIGPNEAKPDVAKLDGAGTNQNRPNEANATGTEPSSVGANQNRPNEANPNGTGRNGIGPSEAKPEVAKLDGAGANQNRPNEANSTGTEPNKIGPNEAKPEAAKLGGAKPTEKQPNEAKRVRAPKPTDFTPFLFAVRAGHIDVVKVLLAAGADPNETLADGTSALVLAAMNARYELGVVLLDHDARPNAAGSGFTAMHQVVWTRRPNIHKTPSAIPTGDLDSIGFVQALVKHGGDVNARETKEPVDGNLGKLKRIGATPLILAAKGSDPELMRLLLSLGADASLTTNEHITALETAAGIGIYRTAESPGTNEEALECVKIALENGGDVNHVDDTGRTAMHGAALRGANAIVQLLYDRGAKLDVVDKKGWTPLVIAEGVFYPNVFKSEEQTAELLLKLGAKHLEVSEAVRYAGMEKDGRESAGGLDTTVGGGSFEMPPPPKPIAGKADGKSQ